MHTVKKIYPTLFFSFISLRVAIKDKQEWTQKSYIAENILNDDMGFARNMTEHLYLLSVNKNLP